MQRPDMVSPTDLPLFPRRFYAGDAVRVAKALLGHYLMRVTREEGVCGGIIVETEAYGEGDPASHGFRGPTRRNRAMFGPPGHAYVYFIYGNHYCFNVVCSGPGRAEAVLVRALEPVFAVGAMRVRRGGLGEHQLTSGPGKLCAALGITRAHDGADLCGETSEVRLALNPAVTRVRRQLAPLAEGPRVGITQAAERPWRFRLMGSPHCSRGPVWKGPGVGRVAGQ